MKLIQPYTMLFLTNFSYYKNEMIIVGKKRGAMKMCLSRGDHEYDAKIV